MTLLGTNPLPRSSLQSFVRISAIAVSFAMATPMSGQLASGDSIPQIGEIAPEFGLRGATRYGVLQDPVRLSDFRGQTVVLAFRWAERGHFPMLFAADTEGIVGKRYGAYQPTKHMNNRMLYVIGPDGRITFVARPFNALYSGSYVVLGEAVAHASSAPVRSP